MVSAIILAGGYATRLRPLSLTKPKALFPVLGKPILDYIIEGLEDAGIHNIYISLRVMADKILSHVDGKSVTPIIEKEPLGDAGALKYVSNQVKLDDVVMVIYGDIYSEVDFLDLLKFHAQSECPVTLLATKVDNPRRYGVLLTEDNKLIEIIEKPSNPISNLINGGVYVFNKDILNSVQGSSISRNFLPKILDKYCISVYTYEGIWADIGTPYDYMKLNFELLGKRFPRGYISSNAKVSERVTLTPPYFISDGVNISEESYIDSNTIIGRSSIIKNDVYIGESLIMENALVNKNSFIKGSIIADKCKIGKWNHIREETIFGEEVITYDGILINRKNIILPNKEVTESIYEEDKIIL
ncbi:NDP-sugar synthase [Acidianus sp. HS-5]|uniref:sugar phosphate nucleotidyltransferase n=1 Tax=Acidianus sp. HS-5 TaxID=2886040 RepID=UPI001F1D8D72|nr:NDP-sugar synthase [Acidianus sp. HS-5]BDC19709.1 mannose-1-phosphate guanylyltransferase [Acidianus sp. HS-5]